MSGQKKNSKKELAIIAKKIEPLGFAQVKDAPHLFHCKRLSETIDASFLDSRTALFLMIARFGDRLPQVFV